MEGLFMIWKMTHPGLDDILWFKQAKVCVYSQAEGACEGRQEKKTEADGEAQQDWGDEWSCSATSGGAEDTASLRSRAVASDDIDFHQEAGAAATDLGTSPPAAQEARVFDTIFNFADKLHAHNGGDLATIGLWLQDSDTLPQRPYYSMFQPFASAMAYIYFTVSGLKTQLHMHVADLSVPVRLLSVPLGGTVSSLRVKLVRKSPSLFYLSAGTTRLFFDLRALGSGEPELLSDLPLWQSVQPTNLFLLEARGWQFWGNCALLIRDGQLQALRYTP
jgi:hypothetical protein